MAQETSPSRDRPLPPALPVADGRDAYLAENGFSVEGYEAKWTEASFLGVRFRVPNTRRHAWAIMMHDLHHVATGYGTDLVGEAEVSAWELRRGLRGLGAYVGSIIVAGTLAGLLFAPRRTLRAWRASSPDRRSLFQSTRPYDDLLAMSVADLRRELAVPEAGLALHRRDLHAYAPPRLQGNPGTASG
jgi:hypothetical protein